MAPELKRVRSKPAEWWAAQPTTSSPPPAAQEAAIAPKKRDRAQSLVNKTQNAGNKGKAVKRKSRGDEEDGENIDPEPSKPVRRGRSSVGEKELGEITQTSSTNVQLKPPTISKQMRPDDDGNGALLKTSKRRKPSVPAQEDEDEDPLAEDHVAPKKLARSASHHKRKGEDTVQLKSKESVPKEKQTAPKNTSTTRRGRSSNTEAELQAVNYKEAATRKPTSLNIEAKASDVVKDAKVVKKALSRGAEDEPRPKENSKTFQKLALPQIPTETATHEAIIRRGRSSNTEAELQFINYKEKATRKQGLLYVGDDAQVKAKEPKVPRRDRSSNQAAEPRAIKGKITSVRQPGPLNEASQVSSEDTVPSRRGRSSNTEAELQAVNYKETATRKQARTDAVVESPTGAVERSTSRMGGDYRRGRSSNTEAELRAQVNYKESKTLSKRVVPDTTAKPQSSVNATSQNKSKHAMSRRDFVAGSAQPGPSRKGDIVQEVQSQDPDVEAASSKFSKSRTKSAARPTVEAKKTTSKAQSTNKNPEKTKKGRKKNEVAVAKVAIPPVTKTKRSSEGGQPKRKSVAEEAILELPAPKRQRNDRAQEQDQPENAPEYQHLAAINRKVSRTTIESKWEALPPSCAERISGLLQDIQRPVIARLGDEQKRSQASTALQTISRKLVTKISRGLPFPPSIRNNREDDFDFEKILDHTRSMESQLTPALHANDLLEAELAKEKALLVAEQAYLDELEGNAKAESAKRKQGARNIHALLQPSGATDVDELDDDFSVNTTDSTRPVTLDLLQDENLQTVVADLQGHVDSIEGNLKQVEGIAQAMAKSKAAVQVTLFGRLDSTQYEDLVLG